MKAILCDTYLEITIDGENYFLEEVDTTMIDDWITREYPEAITQEQDPDDGLPVFYVDHQIRENLLEEFANHHRHEWTQD